MGSPAENYVWEQLDRFLDTEFSYKNGEKIKIICTCIDTGGHFTQEVYQYVKPREIKRIFGIKGQGGDGKSFISKPTKTNRMGISLFVLGINSGKETILSRLKIDLPGPKYMHFPDNVESGYDEAYFKGITSEVKTTVWEKGKRKTVWKTIGTKRNEPLDIMCEVLPCFRQALFQPIKKSHNNSFLPLRQSVPFRNPSCVWIELWKRLHPQR